MNSTLSWAAALLTLTLLSNPARAQVEAQPASDTSAVLELRFTPTTHAQLAIWVERGDGAFLSTVRLTEAVAKRGIGNRPGASQMNSGFRWPYGRREGVLPIWAARRAAAAGARPFRRVIYQNRVTEGHASRSVPDFSRDDYFCLSFNMARARKDALDAVSCASVFSSDKGRFITQADVDAHYAEPYERPGAKGVQRELSLTSPYPPRSDFTACAPGPPECHDHPDSASFGEHVRSVMPDIDAVTMATPAGSLPQNILFPLPSAWPPGAYRACLEINTEGDYNAAYNDSVYPTPTTPPQLWDTYAVDFGYPYRGQPSVAYCADFEIGAAVEQSVSVSNAAGSAGSWDFENPNYGQLSSMDGMTDDPLRAPGSGADRLQRLPDGSRMTVLVKPPLSCLANQPPSAVEGLQLAPYPDPIHAHQWASLAFEAASDDRGVVRYEVRVSTAPISDDASFRAAMPAKQASETADELLVPLDRAAGEVVRVDIGGLVAETHYYVAVRAMDGCTNLGPLRAGEITTGEREFRTVTPCFVATAAFGNPLAKRVGALRGLRDRYLQSNALGRALVTGYYAAGPRLASVIAEHAWLRSATRAALSPLILLAEFLEHDAR